MKMELLTADAQKFFARLSEKDKRLFAGLEAIRLGQYGVQEVSEFYHIHPHTVRRGKRELTEDSAEDAARVRRVGGGRKRCELTYPELDSTFRAILREHTAGDPMQEDARWTYLDNTAIRDRLHANGCPVSIPVVKRLLKKHKYGQRRMVKRKTFKQDPDRNTQFEQIQALTEAEAGGPNPILSMDTKKTITFYNTGMDVTYSSLSILFSSLPEPVPKKAGQHCERDEQCSHCDVRYI
jgi:hypothetical protein